MRYVFLNLWTYYTKIYPAQQWRSNVNLKDLKQQEWDRQTFAFWIELVKEYPPEVSGLEVNFLVISEIPANLRS